ncbi:hypothetical protein LIER_24267 [Lithospermum erythrorhizon]|uniref:RNase H type-1 domain-containing protein n=1 Tax=Lithospermum erythrorhizon TaxID=34254 RepID=A0AAV3R0R9_LITER
MGFKVNHGPSQRSVWIKHESLVKYHVKAIQLAKKFEQIVLKHIPRAQNEEANHLLRLAMTYYDELPQGVYMEVREVPTYEGEITLLVIEEPTDWMTPKAQSLVNGHLPDNVTEARKIKNRSFRFYMYEDELYKKSWDGPLLRCVSIEDISKTIPRTWHASNFSKYYV